MSTSRCELYSSRRVLVATLHTNSITTANGSFVLDAANNRQIYEITVDVIALGGRTVTEYPDFPDFVKFFGFLSLYRRTTVGNVLPRPLPGLYGVFFREKIWINSVRFWWSPPANVYGTSIGTTPAMGYAWHLLSGGSMNLSLLYD